MKVLVTGGSGYLGTHIRQFFDADDFSRRSGLDILNLQDVSKVEEYDVVIHLAAYLDKNPDNSEECFMTNVDGTVNLLRSMKENSVFIFASTKDVYGKHADNFDEVPENCLTNFSGQSPLEWSKLIAEKYVEYYAKQRNFRSCIFRLSTVYAPKSEGNEPTFVSHYLDAVNNGETLVLPANGTPKRDLLYITDFAEACQKFIDSDIKDAIYNLGGGYDNTLTLRELVTEIEKVTGATAVIDETVKTSTPVPLHYISDISKVQYELDWKPNVSVEEGLKLLLNQ